MTSALCRSAAPGRIIAPWAGKIAGFFRIIAKTILTIVEIVCKTLHALGACCRNELLCPDVNERSESLIGAIQRFAPTFESFVTSER
jgi:hypothetical protein